MAAQTPSLSFSDPQTIETDQAIASLAIGDFNQDGVDDIAAFSGEFRSGLSKLMHWYAGPLMAKRVLNSTFYPDSIQQFPGAAASADIDGDSDIDLILGNARHGGSGAGEINWIENPGPSGVNGDWPVHTAASFDSNAGHMNDIAIVDVDQDGKLDILMRHLGNAETLRILFQDNAATDQWTVRSLGDLPFREGMGAADLDRDGDPDILMNGYWLETPANPRTDAFVQHTLDAFYTSQNQSGLNNSTKQAFGDINGDGRTDVVLSTAEGELGWLAWYTQPENPRSEPWPRVRLEQTTGMHTLELADFDNDGDLDLLTGRALSNKGVALWLNDGIGNFTKLDELSSSKMYTGRPFDADGDGDLDIVGQTECCRDGTLYWMENKLVDDGGPIPATPAPTNTPADPGPTSTPSPATPTPTQAPASACPTSPTVHYLFDSGSGSAIFDQANTDQPLDLTIMSGSTAWLDGGGLQISSAARIESADPASSLISAAQASDAFTIQLWIEPANVTQDGPARIVTLSDNGSNRNFTVGQGRWSSQPKDLFDVRLRTDDNGISDDGKPALTSPSGSAKVGLTHLVYVRDGAGNATIYIDGQPVVSDSRPGAFDNWDIGMRLGLANEFGSERPWVGTFYEVGIYACPFTAGDVSTSFVSGIGNNPTPPVPTMTPTTTIPVLTEGVFLPFVMGP